MSPCVMSFCSRMRLMFLPSLDVGLFILTDVVYILLCRITILWYITSMYILKRRQQNQKFPSFQMFRIAAGGVGGAANKNDRKFLVFAPHELVERGRGAVRRFVQNAFERSRIIPPKFDFRTFCPRTAPREARKGEEKTRSPRKVRLDKRRFGITCDFKYLLCPL